MSTDDKGEGPYRSAVRPPLDRTDDGWTMRSTDNMSGAYREPGSVDRTADIFDKLEEHDAMLSRILEAARKPAYKSDDAFWLAVWPRILWPLVTFAAVCFVGGYSCNHDDNITKAKVAEHRPAQPTPEPAK